MKIAFLLPSLDEKGPEIFTENLIKGLLIQGCVCEVFYFNDSTRPINFPVRCTKISFYKAYDFSSFDIVQSTMAKPDIYMALHKNKIKSIWVSAIHCFMKEDLKQTYCFLKSWIYGKVWAEALKKTSNIIVSSNPMLTYYKKLLQNNSIRWELIPYGIPKPILESVDYDTSNKLLRLKSQYTVLVGCGSLIKRKGFYQLVNYLSHNLQAAVVLIGEGECRVELEKQAEALKVKERLLFLGYRSKSVNYYPYFDVYCMCSNSEGFGLAMLEAMSLGLPVVCSQLDIYQGYFAFDDVAFFKFGNQETFNQAVDKAILNKNYYSNRSLDVFSKKFSLESMAKSHVGFYNELIVDKI